VKIILILNQTQTMMETRQNFEAYLLNRGLKLDTASQHRKHVSYFLAWLAQESLALVQITHAEILDFVDAVRAEGRSVNHTNRILRSLGYYFAFLAKEQTVSHNPALGIILKGSMRTVPSNLLDRKELDALYATYEITDDRTHRNKVILGMVTCQALTRRELETLRPEHIRLREGKLQMPATGKTCGRLLALERHQILDLQEYLLMVRPRLQQGSQRLFCGRQNLESLKNSLLHLGHALRRINPKVRHISQLRQSAITEWLKEKDLRTVQYMAGHRYVSSTERYQTTNLEELRQALSKHHPLK